MSHPVNQESQARGRQGRDRADQRPFFRMADCDAGGLVLCVTRLLSELIRQVLLREEREHRATFDPTRLRSLLEWASIDARSTILRMN